jgi:hypothetical protein
MGKVLLISEGGQNGLLEISSRSGIRRHYGFRFSSN